MPLIVDPRFGAELRRLRTVAGISLRQLAPLVLSSRGHLHDIEIGRRRPTVDLAQRLDDALNAAGHLARLVRPAPASGDPDRLAYIRQHPRSVDPATLDALTDILAAHRRLEDTVGAAAVLPAVRAQLDLITTLTADTRCRQRPRLVDLAAQWAQFGGWLHAVVDQPRLATRWYTTALAWGTEAGNTDMVATAMSMRGHLAWQARRPGPLIRLSAEALRQPASPGVRAIAAQQQARGHALLGEASAAIGLLDQAVDLATQAAENPDREPPWVYFHSLFYLQMQRGLTYRLLGDHNQAIEHIRAGLDGLPPYATGAAWTGPYLLILAATLAEIGDVGAALEAYSRAAAIGRATGTTALASQAETAADRLSARRVRTPRTWLRRSPSSHDDRK